MPRESLEAVTDAVGREQQGAEEEADGRELFVMMMWRRKRRMMMMMVVSLRCGPTDSVVLLGDDGGVSSSFSFLFPSI